MNYIKVIVVAFALVGCSDQPPLAEDVVATMKQEGIDIRNVKIVPKDTSSLIPNSFRERVSFEIPEVSPKGGQVFVCDKKEYCDSIYNYYKAVGTVLVGPYLIQSKSGVVVGQFNKGLSPDTAEKMINVIKKY